MSRVSLVKRRQARPCLPGLWSRGEGFLSCRLAFQNKSGRPARRWFCPVRSLRQLSCPTVTGVACYTPAIRYLRWGLGRRIVEVAGRARTSIQKRCKRMSSVRPRLGEAGLRCALPSNIRRWHIVTRLDVDRGTKTQNKNKNQERDKKQRQKQHHRPARHRCHLQGLNVPPW